MELAATAEKLVKIPAAMAVLASEIAATEVFFPFVRYALHAFSEEGGTNYFMEA